MIPEEQHQLLSIPAFGQLTPALPLLCFELDATARELACLRPGSKPAKALSYNPDAATEYTQRKQSYRLNPRALLTPEEEARVLGSMVSARPSAVMRALDLPSYVSLRREIASVEKALQGMLVTVPALEKKSMPLTAEDVGDNELSRANLAELS